MYPKAKYHPTEPHKVVHSEAEEKELGKEWIDSPNFNTPAPQTKAELKAEQKAEEKAEAAAELESAEVEESEPESEFNPDSPRRGRPPKHK